MKRGLLLVLEGGDGCGKSTQAALLHEWLTSRGHTSQLTPGLGGSRALHTVLRHEMLRVRPEGESRLSDTARVLLSAADHAQHLSDTVEPARMLGVVVVSDRGWASNVVYHGYVGGADPKWIIALERQVMAGPWGAPDLTLIIDCAADVALARATDPNYFEALGLRHAEKVCEGYRELAIDQRLPVVNGDQSMDDVFADVLKHVKPLLEEAQGKMNDLVVPTPRKKKARA